MRVQITLEGMGENLRRMNIGIASDHAGFGLKETLISSIREVDWQNFGCHSEKSMDYPDVVPVLCKSVLHHEVDYGVLLCGTSIGVSITANRFRGIRAALCHNSFTAEISRKHNDANILVMGARILSNEKAISMFNLFISTQHEGGRHQRRVEKIDGVVDVN